LKKKLPAENLNGRKKTAEMDIFMNPLLFLKELPGLNLKKQLKEKADIL